MKSASNKTRVCFFAGGLDATLKARVLPLIKALGEENIESNVIRPIRWQSIAKGKLGNILSLTLSYRLEDYARILRSPPDVVIIGRISTFQTYIFLKALQKKGVKVIFDLDDALFLPTAKIFGISIRPGTFCLEKMIENADAVTVNGHYLLEYVKPLNRNAYIIPDPVDTDLFSSKSRNPKGQLTVGWEGVPRNHYENLPILIKPLGMLAKEYDVRFKIVSYLGDQNLKEMFAELENLLEVDYGLDHWVPATELPSLMSEFDIMLSPLKQSQWYEGKSGLRAGLGMSLGIPVIGSPVGEQKFVIDHGVSGFLAKNEGDWYSYLRMLIDDDYLRESMGKQGRQKAERDLSMRTCGKKLANLIDQLLH